MKKNLFSILIAGLIIGLSSCDDTTTNDPITTATENLITTNINENTTWETGMTYVLGARVAVLDGVTLTIQPGVIIKGQAGSGTNATALIITRGGKIMAEGTETQPIIFTSVADEIEPGQIESPNLDPDLNGLWGGVIILGKAKISADAASVQIEGIPASDPNGLYGGDNDEDDSGVFKYVSIRHGGTNIGEGNEINGLTLGGVGSKTVIDHIEVVANQDDGVEFFGGTVSPTNFIVWNNGDDAFDTDQGWNGTLDNFLAINPGDEGMELDGGEGTWNATQHFKNGTIQADNCDGLADLDDHSIDGVFDPISSTNVNMTNIYFFELTYGQDFDDNPETLTASNLQATLPSDTLSLADFFVKGTDAYVTAVATPTVGADVSEFTGWTWAALAGAIK